ncbi:hypothetical protein ACLB2K_030485 [Fragaria x ananassa]
MEEAHKSTDNLVVQMRRKLSLYDLNKKVRLSAVFFADKIPNKLVICNTMKSVLARFGNIGVTASNERDPNDRMFSITAEDAESAKDILDGSPWSIMRYSVHFQEWPESLAIEELQCNQIAFWVQVRGVPPYMFEEENVKEMAEKFGEFIRMYDPLESEEGTYSILRVRILLDARDPLPTGYELPREDGSKKWVSFAFEKLSDFCYVCGRIGHVDLPKSPCPHGADPENENEYGDWLRAFPPRKQIRKEQSQIKTASGRSRRRFPGQTIQPVEGQDNRQNSQPQGALSSQINDSQPRGKQLGPSGITNF